MFAAFSNDFKNNLYLYLFIFYPAGEFASNPVYLEKCACKSTCNETQYSAKISGYTFPSENFRKDFEDMLNGKVISYVQNTWF